MTVIMAQQLKKHIHPIKGKMCLFFLRLPYVLSVPPCSLLYLRQKVVYNFLANKQWARWHEIDLFKYS